MDEFLIWLVATVTGYLVVRDGVTRGMLAAWKKQEQLRAKQAASAPPAARPASRGP